MRKNAQSCRLTISERVYAFLVWLYPKPFRDNFGTSMKQVFRDQCSDAIRQRGWSGWIGLWIRVLFDFAWTCPKEHLIALPTIPGRLWERLVAGPIWLYPVLAALACFLIGLAIALQLPRYHSSSVVLLRRVVVDKPQLEGFESRALRNIEPPTSTLVLDPVIEKLELQALYQKELKTPNPLTKEDAFKILSNRIAVIEKPPRSAVITVKVYDDDKAVAQNIAKAITDQYMRVFLDFARSGTQGQFTPQTANVTVLKQPEISDRLVRPGFRNWVAIGGTAALITGAAIFLCLFIIRRRDRLTILSANRCDKLQSPA
ncbi:hypothetical protein GC207_03365 [bacterium]|nr:hypothetical protein [bacterium]